MGDGRFLSLLSKCRAAEPVIFLYAFGLLVHSPLIQQYVYDRVSEDKGFDSTTNSRTECANDTELHDEVESKASYYMLGLIFFAAAPSLVSALLIGAWSDKVGRKYAIFLPCFGATIDLSITLTVIYFDFPLSILFIGSFINGMMGYFPAMLLVTMAYIADTTEASMRAARLGILEFFVFIGATIGQAVSGKIIESNGGYKLPYCIIVGCLVSATLYSIFLVPETLPSEQRSKADFFDRKHFQRIFNLIQKKETNNSLRRLIFVSFVISVCSNGAYTITILFLLDRPLCWSPLAIGLFSAERFFGLGVGAVIAVKVLSRWFETMKIIYFGLFSYAVSLFIFAFAKKTWVVVSVPVVGMFIGGVFAFLRGMMSKQTSQDQQGCLFAAIGFFDTLATIIAAVLFNLLYPLSLKFDFNGFSFLISALLGLVALFLVTRLDISSVPAAKVVEVEDVEVEDAEVEDAEVEDADEKRPLMLHNVNPSYST